MPRIPRAEVSLETRIADQPFSTGDGYSAPGRAMQQLGQGIASFGAGLDAWAAKEDEQNAYKDDLTLLKAANQADRDLITFRETYRGDGSDYERGAQEIIDRNLNVGDQLVSKRGRERFALNYERLSGARREQAMRQGVSLREKALYEDTATAISGQMQQLLESDKDPEAFTANLEKKLSEIEMIIDRMPIGAHRTALEKHAATLAKSMLEGRGLKELPIANELIKKWSAGSGEGAGSGASIEPAGGGQSIVRARSGAAVKVSSQYADRFAGLIGDLEAAGVQINSGETSGYANRNIAGSNIRSRHAFGEAIDINWNQNTRGSGGQITKQLGADTIREIAARNGLKWGGDWKNPDPMHFEVDRSAKYQSRSVAAFTKEGLQADASGRIDPAAFASHMESRIERSSLNGTVPPWGAQFGIRTGSPAEWARFFTMLQQQESGHRIARVNPDGSLQRFPTTPPGEQSYGPGQFKPGEYGLKTWADVNNPEKVAEAYIKVAEAGKIAAYFGSVQRPGEVAQHGKWFDNTVRPKIAQSRVASSQRGQQGGILTSLEDAPSVEEIDKERPSIVDMDLNKRGANKALMAAKRVGAKVAAYHEGGGGGASWGEGERDLKSDKELAKLSKDAKALAAKGADYLHVDNMHNLDAAGIGKVAEAVRQATDGKMSIIAKNNPAAWVEAIKANPEIKPPYAIIEHGMKDPATLAAAKQLAEMGVPVHFVEFGDPGKDKISGKPRTDPISTAEEARAFAKGNAWANVIHMPSQDRYDGRSVNGAQVFRGEQPSEGGPTQVAQARTGVSDAGPSNIIGTRRGVRGHLIEMLIKDMDQMGKRHQKMQEHLAALQQVDRWLTGQDEFNKYNDDSRKLLDKAIAGTGLADKIMKGEPEAIQFGIMASQVTNYNLKPVAEGLLGLVKSTDPLKRVRGYEAAGSILDRNPDAFDVGDDEKKLAQEARDYQAQMRVIDPGLPLVDQQKLAVARIDERRSPEWAAKAEARKKVGEANAKGFTADTIASKFDAVPIIPFTNPNTVDGDVIALKYAERYKEHFTRIGDDAQAKLLADDDLKREYGVSSALGRKEVMRHPPERRYPTIINPVKKEVDHSYIVKDLEKSVSAYAEEPVTIDRIKIRADEQTDREIRAGRPPSYLVTYTDKSGRQHDIPAVKLSGGRGGRWSLSEQDITAIRKQAAKDFGEMRAKESLEKSKSLGQKAKELFEPPPEWKDRPETPEQKAIKDFLEKLKKMTPSSKGERAPNSIPNSIGGSVTAP